MNSSEVIEPTGTGVADVQPPAGVTLTPAAVAKVMELLELEAGEGLRLRIAVQPGGCSGLRYQLFFDQRSFEGDYVARLGDADEPASEPAPGYDSGYESGSDE